MNKLPLIAAVLSAAALTASAEIKIATVDMETVILSHPQSEENKANLVKLQKEFEPAAGLLDRAVAHYGVNAALMNAIGECYEGLGKTREALAAYEKSLQLSPDQPDVKARVEALKKKAPR